ncbi:AIPR family protein [Ruminococcus sp. FC2018]|uniref:AIPR family protein n=1 Tax=Ruminococcus sp. FC2018 TaxID=1410617 RepID=UPI00048C5131|nr:AIPR family protein [Ruminococcus sp. FC2018]
MRDFKEQLLEDFQDYRERFPNIQNIEKDEWAFNFWILDNLFSIDEDIIEDNIVDYNDKGIDCFVWHEEEQDLYLIQNKFYSDETKLTVDYINNDFLTRAIGALEKGTYTRSKTLQDIFTKYSGNEDFSVHFYLYVTSNTSKTQTIIDTIAKFNEKYASKRYDAKLFSLDDIKESYYQEPIVSKKKFKYTIKTINKGTILNVDNDAYKMTLALDAKYVLTPVTVIYKMYDEAKKAGYPLFDANIRDYLGSNGAVNKKIMTTLKDPNDRNNFFFYNNGITMIVNEMTKDEHSPHDNMRVFDVIDPQIVNGCQTVSTIYETLNSLPEGTLERDFSDSFVMVKILKIPASNNNLTVLYHNIVTYNNSQNSINEKNFTAIKDVFKHIQTDFEWKGLLLCIKQSDKNSFSQKYKTVTPLLDKCCGILERFGLSDYKKPKDFFVDLEKFLQVILAFDSDAYNAIQNKSKLLKDKSSQNTQVIDFIKNKATTNDMFQLYLLYLRAEMEKKNSTDEIKPNPFYVINSFARYECDGKAEMISSKLDTQESISNIIKKYILLFKWYCKNWRENNPNKGYNDMIKTPVDYQLLDKSKEDVERLMSML